MSMFGLHLACLYSVCAAGLLAGVQADGYRGEIEKLDATRPESVCQARTALRQRMPKADIVDRAAMFRAFREFYLRTMQSSTARFADAIRPFHAELEDLKRKPEVRQVTAPWSVCGFTFDESEGELYPEQDSATFAEFLPQLPADLAEYTRFRARELAQKVGGDATLALSWEQLRERLARWEDFSRRHPSMPETPSELAPAIRNLADSLFFGEDNTWTFDLQNGRINGDVVAAWRRLAALNRMSHYQALAAEMVVRLKKHDGRITEDERALFARFGMADSFDLWWRYVQARQKF